ncbi:MAG TPA: BolA family protein [Steroidobacteraceae bacterium]|nr:BolA family protein [Steroidobacteraceae bacterium]
MSAATRTDRIIAALRSTLQPQDLALIDDSHLHAGHAGARDGRGHFRVRIVATQFAGLRPLQRHQLVYRSLGELMQTDIHALNIEALTPEEANG